MLDEHHPSDPDLNTRMPSLEHRIGDSGEGQLSVVDKTRSLAACPQCGQRCDPGDAACKNCGCTLRFEDCDETRLRIEISGTCPRCGQDCQPGQLACPKCGPAFDGPRKIREGAASFNCPKCGQPCEPGARFCLGCGYFLLVDPDSTSDFSGQLAEKTTTQFPGPDPDDDVPLIFEVEGARLMLPSGKIIVVGRRSSKPGDIQPDVDLGAFGALDKGVSRRHLRIKRRGTLAYIADIGSANGTWLNGHHMVHNGERLLRHGDELQLSHLKIRVLFSVKNEEVSL